MGSLRRALDAADLFHDARALVQQRRAGAGPARRSARDTPPAPRQRLRASSASPPRRASKPCFSSRMNDSNWISSDALSAIALDQAHDGAAHHHRFHLPAQFRHVLRPRDAEAHRQRQIGHRAHRLRPAARRHRKAIRARPSRRCATPDRRSRSNIAPPACRRRSVLVGAARNTVSRPAARMASTYSPASSTLASVSRQPSMPAASASARQPLQAVAHHRIQIGEQQQRNLRPPADLRRDLQHFAQRGAGRQRALARALDHRTIGDGIGKRHAQLDQVRAAALQRFHQRGRALGRWDRRR